MTITLVVIYTKRSAVIRTWSYFKSFLAVFNALDLLFFSKFFCIFLLCFLRKNLHEKFCAVFFCLQQKLFFGREVYFSEGFGGILYILKSSYCMESFFLQLFLCSFFNNSFVHEPIFHRPAQVGWPAFMASQAHHTRGEGWEAHWVNPCDLVIMREAVVMDSQVIEAELYMYSADVFRCAQQRVFLLYLELSECLIKSRPIHSGGTQGVCIPSPSRKTDQGRRDIAGEKAKRPCEANGLLAGRAVRLGWVRGNAALTRHFCLPFSCLSGRETFGPVPGKT